MQQGNRMESGSAVEKRLHGRRPYRTRIIFNDEFGEGLFYVYSEDVSLGGIFLASDIPVRTGSLLFLSFELPGHKRPIEVTAQVVRKTSGEKPASSGIGVRFVGFSEMAQRRLEDFLDKKWNP